MNSLKILKTTCEEGHFSQNLLKHLNHSKISKSVFKWFAELYFRTEPLLSSTLVSDNFLKLTVVSCKNFS